MHDGASAEPREIAEHHVLSIAHPATPQAGEFLRRAVVDYANAAGGAASALASVQLAVSEAVTNAVVHGYDGPDAAGTIAVDARVTDDGRCLIVTVSDDGKGMGPRHDSPGLGLGLPLIATLTASLEIGSQGAGSALRMTFDLDGGANGTVPQEAA